MSAPGEREEGCSRAVQGLNVGLRLAPWALLPPGCATHRIDEVHTLVGAGSVGRGGGGGGGLDISNLIKPALARGEFQVRHALTPPSGGAEGAVAQSGRARDRHGGGWAEAGCWLLLLLAWGR